MQVASQITEHINKLTEAIIETKTTIEDETYGMDPEDTLVAPLMLSPLKMEFPVQALQSGTEEYDVVLKSMGTLMLDFSELPLADVYSIQYAATTELCIR